MIKVVIIEDEAPARKKLKNFLAKINEDILVVKEMETVEDTLAYFESEHEEDVIISDIELRDTNVFEAFSRLSIQAPIIFTTAYNQFWMNAFETNGIEYLLKPFSFARFEKAWNKYNSLRNNFSNEQDDLIKKLDKFYQSKTEVKPVYKKYLPVKSNSSIYFLQISDILFIQSDYGVIFAFDSNNKRHVLNQNSLKELQDMLNPEDFFKINRSELVNRKYIEKIDRYTKNTVAIHVKSHTLKTSQNSTAAFNNWLGI